LGERPGTSQSAFSVVSASSGGEGDTSKAAQAVRQAVRQGSSKTLSKAATKPHTPNPPDAAVDRRLATVNPPGSSPTSTHSQPPKKPAVAPYSKPPGLSAAYAKPAKSAAAKATKENPMITKARTTAQADVAAEERKRRSDSSALMKAHEVEARTREHQQELSDAVEEGRRRVQLLQAKKMLGQAPAEGGDIALSDVPALPVKAKMPTDQSAKLRAMEEEKAEMERRELLQEEYIKQLEFEREAKLQREEARRLALKQLRSENEEIVSIIQKSEEKTLQNMEEANMLEVLRRENAEKELVAARLREERERVLAVQAEREAEIAELQKEVDSATNAEGIQLMQIERMRKIQDESRRMREQQEEELVRLQEELQKKTDNTEEAREIERLRAEFKVREEEQARARRELDKERAALERSMRQQESLEAERARILKEREERERGEALLLEQTVKEERELKRLNLEVEERKKEVARLHALNEEAKARGEEQGGMLKEQYEQLVREKEALAKHELAVEQERKELEKLNEKREQEVKAMQRLLDDKEELDKTEAMVKRREQEALRRKEETERLRLREEEDRLREALERETAKAQLQMDVTKKKRQAEIEALKRDIEGGQIREDDDDEGASQGDLSSKSKRVSDWVSQTAGGPAVPDLGRRGSLKKQRSDISFDSSMDGSMTERSDTTTGDTTSRGLPTVWRMARHGKIKDLEGLLTSDNVDERDAKGNTCLMHACMHNKKKVAKMLLRLRADINAQNHKGNTCLHYCFSYNYNELGEYLISKGADETIQNELGATCREVAAKGAEGGVTERA